MAEVGSRRRRAAQSVAAASTSVRAIAGRRRTVAPLLQRPYRSGLAAGLAVAFVGAVSGAAVVEDDAQNMRAGLVALEAAPGTTVVAPEVEDWALEPVEVDVELDKENVAHLREVQVAARNAERRAIAEREAEAAAAAEREAAAEDREAAAEESAPEERQVAPNERQATPDESADSSAQEPAPAVNAAQGGERGSLAGMVNSYRGQNGLSSLSRNGTLDQVAQSWAQHMAGNQVLQHNPNYASQIGGGWSRSGENIVRNTGAQSWSSGRITSWMFNWWQNSAPHRANILNSAYTHVGVGYAMGSGGPYAVLVFGGR